MAQIELVKKEVDYLRNCVRRLDNHVWQARKDIASLKENSNHQNLRDLNGRVDYFESELQEINGESFIYRARTWAELSRIGTKVDQLWELYTAISKVISAFARGCTNILRATLRTNDKVHGDSLKIELIID